MNVTCNGTWEDSQILSLSSWSVYYGKGELLVKAEVLLSMWSLSQWNLEAQLVLQGFLKGNSDTSRSCVKNLQEAFRNHSCFLDFTIKVISDVTMYFFPFILKLLKWHRTSHLLWTFTHWHAAISSYRTYLLPVLIYTHIYFSTSFHILNAIQ